MQGSRIITMKLLATLFKIAVLANLSIFIKAEEPNPLDIDENPICDYLLWNNNENVNAISYNEDPRGWLSKYSSECRSVFVVRGWLGKGNWLYLEMVENLLGVQEECHNVILVEWPASEYADYAQAAESVFDVGTHLGEFLAALHEWGLMGSTVADEGRGGSDGAVEIVGHDLGAHIAGISGRLLRELRERDSGYGGGGGGGSGDTVDLITALDPAGLLFTDNAGRSVLHHYRLRADDADKVVVLHTNAGVSGTIESMGRWDFYANDGIRQPGCFLDCYGYCSHHRAIEIYTESISSGKFVAKGTPGHPPAVFGRSMCPKTAPGKYYFKTNAKKPFARG